MKSLEDAPTNGQMSKYVSLIDIIPVAGSDYIFTMFDNTEHRFLRLKSLLEMVVVISRFIKASRYFPF